MFDININWYIMGLLEKHWLTYIEYLGWTSPDLSQDKIKCCLIKIVPWDG